MDELRRLAEEGGLGSLLDSLRRDWGGYDLLWHHQQGEFHHDFLIRVRAARPRLPGEYLAISTNCNSGVKEAVCFDLPLDPSSLWHLRCPGNPEFQGEAPPVLAVARTEAWFDPCSLLSLDARSELKSEFRERQTGGGWCRKPASG